MWALRWIYEDLLHSSGVIVATEDPGSNHHHYYYYYYYFTFETLQKDLFECKCEQEVV